MIWSRDLIQTVSSYWIIVFIEQIAALISDVLYLGLEIA